MKYARYAITGACLVLAACSPKPGAGKLGSDKAEAIRAIARGDLATARIDLQNALTSSAADPELHFLNAKVAFAGGNLDLAQTELPPLLANAKFGGEARELLAESFLGSGNARSAAQALGDVQPDSGRRYALAVSTQAMLGHDERAEALLVKGLAAFPQSVELLLVDADMALESGDLARARADSAKSLALAPHDKHGQLVAGRLALITGDKLQAEQRFDSVLKQDATNQAALLAKAAIAHDRGDRDSTNALLTRANKAAGGVTPQTKAYMAQMALEAGDINRANQILQSLPAQADMPYFMMLRGIVAAARGQNEQAVSQLQNYFSHNGENAAARLALSNAFMAIGDKHRAWTFLQPLANAANANPQVLALAEQLAADQKQPDAAATYHTRLQAAQHPDPIAGEMTTADQAIGAGAWKKAATIYQRLLAQPANASNIILLNNAANASLNLGDKAQAVALARRAAAAAPNDPVVADTLGWSLFQQSGATREVIALERKAYTGQPGNLEIRNHLAVIANSVRVKH